MSHTTLGTESSLSDQDILDYLRRVGSATVTQLVNQTGVTATAVRQRLQRLLEQGMIERAAKVSGRGRPTHRYSLTEQGIRSSGTNYEDLAMVLWSEIRAIDDPDIRYGLLKRIVVRLAEKYRAQVQGTTLDERMASLVEVMGGRDIPFEVETEAPTQLPVLTALACPYPVLAEQDRSVCSMEKMLFSEVLGENVRLSACRLDGATHCTFGGSASTGSVSTPNRLES